MKRGLLCLLLTVTALATSTPVASPQLLAPATPLLVTYGHENHPREGDPNSYQILYISVPDTMQNRFLLRVFDPDTDGKHDLAYNQYGDSKTRFAIFGGSGAYQPEASREPMEAKKTAGRLLDERTFGADPEVDDTWQTIAELNPMDGDLVDGRRIFRLLVDGFEGDDANLFTVAAGTPGNENLAPIGVEIFGFRPTLRVPKRGVVPEFLLQVAEDAGSLTIDTFDASGASVELALPLRSLPVPASGDNEWRASEVQLQDEEPGGPAAIVISGGRESPNDLTLYVTDDSGRPVAMALPPRLWAPGNTRPSAVASVMPNDCHAVTLDAGGSSDADGEALSFRWRFNDGSDAEGERVTHRFAGPGTYPIRLEARDTSGQVGRGSTHDFEVNIKRPPVAKADAPRLVAPGEEVQFDGSSSSVDGWTLQRYAWKFGDGTELTGQKVPHAFAEPGQYTATLTVEDDSGHPCNAASDEIVVVVNAPPIAAASTTHFNYSTAGYTDTTIKGEDRRAAIAEPLTFDARASSDSDGQLTGYRWDFGDGAEARGALVEHAYEAAGRYVVRLEVTDDSQVANATTSDEINVIVNAPPAAAMAPPRYVSGGLVEFDGSGSIDEDGAVARYAWDFGDGSTGSGPRPSHVYKEPGSYDIELTVTDNSGMIRNTATAKTQVVVNAMPIADAGPNIVAAPGEEIVLKGDRSVDPDGEIAEYRWEPGDGTSAGGAVVTHRYDIPGTYFARLAVRDDSGHEEAIDFDEVKVSINQPAQADAGLDVLAAPGESVRLDGSRSVDPDGEIAEYRWDFSDTDEPSTGPVVSRRFEAPGVYTAQLTVSDNSGASNGTHRDEVTIRINHQPVAVAGDDVRTAQRTVIFDGAASADADGDPLNYHWDFGDGQTAVGAWVSHTYDAAGSYPVVLTVDDGTGLANSRHRDSLTVQINQPPIAVAGESREVCTGDVVVFDGGGSSDPDGGVLRYAWDFGDGSSLGIVNPTKIYRKSGTYPVTLSVEDASGLPDGHHADRIFVKVHQSPMADAGGNIRACANVPVHFDGSRSTDRDGVVNRFSWDFGDGASGGGSRPSHPYSRPGRYRAILTIEGDQVGQCDYIATDELNVEIVPAPTPVIEAPTIMPVGNAIRFDGSGSSFEGGGITGWHWDFGDGETADGAVVEYSYTQPGVYRVTLTVDGNAEDPGCRAISTHQFITINAPPTAVAGEDRTVSTGEEILFDGSASVDPDGGLTRYRWDFGDGATAAGMQVHHTYRQAGRYKAALTVEDNAGVANSTAIDTLQVEVTASPPPKIEGPAAACVAKDVRLQAANVSASGEASYSWLLGDGTRAEGAAVTHRYERPGRYPVTLVPDDGAGRSNSRRSITQKLHINAVPYAVAGHDRIGCPGIPIAFDATGSTDPDGNIVHKVWEFGDGTTATGHAVEHTYAQPGIYPVTLSVTDDSGTTCDTATDSFEVVVTAPPAADAGPDQEVWVGGANDALFLDGSRSRHPPAATLDYTWTLPDGEVLKGERVRQTLSRAGEFDITLSVDDLSGRACSVATDTVHVVSRARGP